MWSGRGQEIPTIMAIILRWMKALKTTQSHTWCHCVTLYCLMTHTSFSFYNLELSCLYFIVFVRGPPLGFKHSITWDVWTTDHPVRLISSPHKKNTLAGTGFMTPFEGNKTWCQYTKSVCYNSADPSQVNRDRRIEHFNRILRYFNSVRYD